MPNFLVRIRENGEAVGIFAVEDLDDLVFWVDEVTDPAICEYAVIGSGSIIWEGAAKRIPDPDHDWDREQGPWLDVVGEHDLGGHWPAALFADDLVFHPCVPEFKMAANDP